MKTLLTFIISFILFYLFASFIAFDLDCRNWDALGRYGVVLLSVSITIFKAINSEIAHKR